MLDKILDASIYYSFDKSGFLRHAKSFTHNLQFKNNSNALITGGTSGIGQACANELSKKNVHCFITGRDQLKGDKAASAHDSLTFYPLDMVNWDKINSFIQKLPNLDYVVLNAGGMPDSFMQNDYGVESQFASQLFGHYYLIKQLKKENKLNKNCRIVWVTSGGMYLSNLDLNIITEKPKEYNKVATYANVKRAQVTLLPFLSDEFSDSHVMAMHPGWAETPGVSSAIPQFDKKMKGRLRTPLQGADTILWLLSSNTKPESGSLYFDRKKVSRHLFWFTKKNDSKMSALIEILNKFSPQK